VGEQVEDAEGDERAVETVGLVVCAEGLWGAACGVDECAGDEGRGAEEAGEAGRGDGGGRVVVDLGLVEGVEGEFFRGEGGGFESYGEGVCWRWRWGWTWYWVKVRGGVWCWQRGEVRSFAGVDGREEGEGAGVSCLGFFSGECQRESGVIGNCCL